MSPTGEVAQALVSPERSTNEPGHPERNWLSQLSKTIIASRLVVLALGSVKLPFLAVIVLAYFVWLRGRYHLDTVELLVIWLVVTPFMGPYFVSSLGSLPAFSFHRFFVLLAGATLLKERRRQHGSLISNKLDYAVLGLMGAILLSIAFGYLYRSPLRIFIDAVLVPFAFYLIAKRCASNPGFFSKLFLGSVLAVTAFVGHLGSQAGDEPKNVSNLPGGPPPRELSRADPARCTERDPHSSPAGTHAILLTPSRRRPG